MPVVLCWCHLSEHWQHLLHEVVQCCPGVPWCHEAAALWSSRLDSVFVYMVQGSLCCLSQQLLM